MSIAILRHRHNLRMAAIRRSSGWLKLGQERPQTSLYTLVMPDWTRRDIWAGSDAQAAVMAMEVLAGRASEQATLMTGDRTIENFEALAREARDGR